MASQSLSSAREMVAGRLAEGDTEGALALADRLRGHFPRDHATLLLAARVHQARGDLDTARDELELVCASLPDQREPWELLAGCGDSGRAAAILADLPPLPSGNGERPAISAAALGHLYLRQLLLPHCASQLEPVWRADGSRLDVGVALAEAHWRLGDADAAEEVCRALLAAAPDCLKANLILAQQLCAAGRREDAAGLLGAAEAVDPEHALAEDLYEWLAVRDPALVPLHRRDVQVDLEAAPPAAPAYQPPPTEHVVREEVGGIEGILGGIEPIQGPIPEPEPFWERRPEPAVEPPAEPWTAPVVPEVEATAQAPAEPWAAPAPEPEAPAEAPAGPEPEPDAEAPVEPWAAPAELPTAPEPPAEPESTPVPERVASEASVPPWAAPAEGPAQPWEAPTEPVAAGEPDVALTSPEPALAQAEGAPALRWLQVSARGQVAEGKPPAGEERVASWIGVCGRAAERLGLGAVQASSVESSGGAIHIQHEPGGAAVALAPPGANLGLVRASLRRGHH